MAVHRLSGILLAGLLGTAFFFPDMDVVAATAQTAPASVRALKQLNVEELMNVEVTSVSRTAETLSGAAAAVTVVTNKDIGRSGAANVPDALRLTPGLNIASLHSSAWVVGSRGFSSVNSEKLLVLSDTRSVYTPFFSGVLWDVQDYLLEDIERIEVIRGPGAALWGSNAVNGVINITTKSAQDTQGVYIEAGAGTEERAFVAARYGGETAGGGHYRVFGKYFERDATFNSNPATSDDWRMGHIGFRADWDASDEDAVTLQAEVYRGNVGQLAPAISITGRAGPQGDLEVDVSGGNVLGRWRRSIDEDSDLQFRAYYDRTHRDDPSFHDDLDTVDLDFQHRFAPRLRHEAIWGLNYRFTSNQNQGKGILALDPRTSRDHLVSAFIQDQISIRDSLRITIGTKLEHNDFSGFEVQPSARAAWDLLPSHTLWGAVSRAVRVPNRLERDIVVDVSNPAGSSVLRLLGNEAFEAEELLAYELGYRWQALQMLSIDVAAFHNRYDGLASLEFVPSFVDPQTGQTILPLVNLNLTSGRAEGAEALITFSPITNWRLTANYSWLNLKLTPAGQDLNRGRFFEDLTPRHQVGLRSFLDLPAGFQLDMQFRRLSSIHTPPQLAIPQKIPGYNELDVRLSWRGWKQLEISLVGRNLLHDRHLEFGAPATRGEIERSVYGKVVWRY